MSSVGAQTGAPSESLRILLGREHEHARFDLRFYRQRNVYSHLVAVEVGVERAASERMEFNGSAVNKHRLERLNTQPVQRRRAVQKYGGGL